MTSNISISQMIDLTSTGYVATRREQLAVEALLTHRNGGAATLLLEGPPGCGKTALGEAIAKAGGWPLVYAQLTPHHHGGSIDPAAAAFRAQSAAPLKPGLVQEWFAKRCSSVTRRRESSGAPH